MPVAMELNSGVIALTYASGGLLWLIDRIKTHSTFLALLSLSKRIKQVPHQASE